MSKNLWNQLSSDFNQAVSAVGKSMASFGGRRRRGTATAIDEEGHFVTAAHLVRHQEEGFLVFPDGEKHDARVVGRDRELDLAVIKVDDAHLPGAPFVDEKARPAVGEFVLSVGRVKGDAQAAFGIVSAVGDAFNAHRGARVDYRIDVDGTLPWGFSGGLLVGADGQAWGMNTHGILRGGTTLVAPTLLAAARDLIENGSRAPGFLGVGIQPTTLSDSQATIAEQEKALLITVVQKQSAAQNAGLLVGDLLLQADGHPTESLQDLWAALRRKAGEKVSLTVLRGSEMLEITAEPGQRPQRHRC
jgi:S1-C subfamily serine protease